jgi:DNA-binding Lrp family transcriptional regulator
MHAMRTIFVKIKCELGKAYKVADAVVQSVDEASEVYSTSGDYDLMVKCYLQDEDDIGRFVTEQLQTLPHIKDTFTLITFKAFQ